MIIGYAIRHGYRMELHATKGWRTTPTKDRDTLGFIWARVKSQYKLKELPPAAMAVAAKRHIHPRSKRNARMG